MTSHRGALETPHRAPRYLLDVNVLLAVIWADHPQHANAFSWVSGKSVLLCPLSELGFLRISTNTHFTFSTPGHFVPDHALHVFNRPSWFQKVTDLCPEGDALKVLASGWADAIFHAELREKCYGKNL